MKKDTLYQDKLIILYDDSLILLKYYFPSLSPKTIFFKDVKNIEVLKPTLFTGKYRIQGTGNFRTWYPFDALRPKRNKVFIIKYVGKWVQSGFTVENSDEVESILREKKLIH